MSFWRHWTGDEQAEGSRRPPVTDGLIASCEARWGLRLPLKLVQLLREQNGGDIANPEFKLKGKDHVVDCVFGLGEPADWGVIAPLEYAAEPKLHVLRLHVDPNKAWYRIENSDPAGPLWKNTAAQVVYDTIYSADSGRLERFRKELFPNCRGTPVSLTDELNKALKDLGISLLLALVPALGALAVLAPPPAAAAASPRAWSFRNHVQPALAKAGCSSGACHGAAAGQCGFRLSLRGYDDDGDWRAITRGTLGRRLDLGDPGRSLLLLKPTGAVPHKGGTRLVIERLFTRPESRPRAEAQGEGNWWSGRAAPEAGHPLDGELYPRRPARQPFPAAVAP